MDPASFAESLCAPLARLSDPLALEPLAKESTPPRVAIRPPGSKSLTNRALLLAALASGRSTLRGALTDADDAQRMIHALAALGTDVEIREDGRVIIEGNNGELPGGSCVHLGAAGTATRFLTAGAALAGAPVEIDGDERMRQRPIGELVALLRDQGVRIDELGEPGHPPLRVYPSQPAGGEIRIATTLSSQYLSALMLIAPWMRQDLTLRFDGPVTSPTYVRMTAALLQRVGAKVHLHEDASGLAAVTIEAQPLQAFDLEIEPDASGATYFWGAAAAVPGAMVTVEGVGEDSLQGDARLVDHLARMGATILRSPDATTVAGQDRLRGVDVDLSDMPDAAMTLATVACFADSPTTIRGLRTLRVKETDRIAALAAELGRVGVNVRVFTDGDDEGIEIEPPENGLDCRLFAPAAEFETYNDHRMAMSLAILGLRRPMLRIKDPACVAKTYPAFWRDWAMLYGHDRSDA